ncbi:MAG TPA: hypothetical protein VKR30_01635 [Candidatus Limnocylindrales bacterium]|nr:hypothetical protein [Candidatus Limnocylindrales bacterium]
MTRLTRSTAIALAALALVAPAALAHGPDPLLPGSGTLWSKDQVVPFQWGTGGTPPSWAAAALDAGAADVAESSGSRAAAFVRTSSAPASMSYGPTACDSFGIACMDRTGMSNGTFRVWFRPQGYAFDWGTLKWCQAYDTAPSGCYDIETTTLDELGHVEVLGHHVNLADESDFTDAVVQYAGHVKPKAGWNQHAFGRCDVATLQLQYERRDPANLVSTCLSLATSMTFSGSTDSVVYGTTVRFAATLKIASTSAGAMTGDPLSDRTVVLQRRAIGSSTWTTVGTMSPSSTTEGAYSMTVGPTATYDWRATFATPSNDGVLGSTTSTFRVTVTTCTGGGCPLSVVRGGD